MLNLPLLLLLAVIPAASTPTTWPSFLGEGAVAGSQSLPLHWSPTESVEWQASLPGHGQSSPVVWGEYVFVTSVEGPKKDTYHILCMEVTSGEQLWQQSIVNSAPVDNSLYVSRAAPTPVVDAERVVALFESGDCVAYSHSGEPLWTRQLGKDFGPFVSEFGLGASPCQTAELVYVLLEHDGPSWLVALDKSTGETVWKAERSPRRSWSSPAIVNVAGAPQIVVSSAGSIDGYDPATGERLWTFADVGGNTGTTPIDCGDGKFLIGAAAGRGGENADGAKKSNGMMQVARTADGWQAQRLWIAEDAAPSWASPIVHQGLAYWINRVGVIHCFDAHSGEPVYVQRTKQSCWATPYAAGDRIYWFGKDGLVTVIAAGRTYRELAENQVWDVDKLAPDTSLPTAESDEQRQRAAAMFSGPTLYGYAVAEGRFLVRIGNRLFSIHAAE